RIEEPSLQEESRTLRERKFVLHPNLRGPGPQVAGIRKGWGAQRSQRAGRQRRKEGSILPCHYGGAWPFEMEARGPHANEARGNTFQRVRKSPEEIELDIGAGPGACQPRPKDL